MATVRAEFDGKVFVPCEAVHLPAGTRVEVFIPNRPPELTEEEKRRWQEILDEINASEPYFPTLDEAMRYTRKRQLEPESGRGASDRESQIP